MLIVKSAVSRISKSELSGEKISIEVYGQSIHISEGGNILLIPDGEWLSFRTPQRLMRFRDKVLELKDGKYTVQVTEIDRSIPHFTVSGELFVPGKFVPIKSDIVYFYFHAMENLVLDDGIMAVKPICKTRPGGFIVPSRTNRYRSSVYYKTRNVKRLFHGNEPMKYVYKTTLPPSEDAAFGTLLFKKDC